MAAAVGESRRKQKKILNRGNEPENVLKAKELAFSEVQNELVFERKNAQTNRRMGPKCWKMETRNSKIETRKSTNYRDPSSSANKNGGLLRMTMEQGVG